MTVDEIRGVLAVAVRTRPPRFEEGESSSRNKVSALEDHMLAAAYQHAELEEAMFWLDQTIASLKAKVDGMVGYEVALPSNGRQTRDTVLAAKRTLDPTTFEVGAEARALREAVRRQIAKFEYETGIMSRVYTLISGS